ncbi:MAG TPA: GIY-YIG nuclease family protein [Methylomirabilota bacterium]|nr:GIY-YIG nuclease family protein [Methylomirabilota bacterium]
MKLGSTTVNPERRFEQLRKEHGLMELFHAIPVQHAFWTERRVHEVFKQQRTRGEWFRLTASDIARLPELVRDLDETAPSLAHRHKAPGRPRVPAAEQRRKARERQRRGRARGRPA